MMIETNKFNKAIQAIQDLIIEARSLAYQKNCTDLARLLDDLELLPSLIIRSGDQTAFFESYLEDICERNDCDVVLTRYKLR